MNTANLCHLLNPKESNGHILYFKETPRRLSSGSACETCRRRKTKCDGGQPCAFCKSNGIQCLRRANKRSTSKAGKKIYRLKNTRRSYTSSTIRNIETASNSSSESSPTYSHGKVPRNACNYKDDEIFNAIC